VEKEPPYPGDWKIETRIKSLMRWNAMAMVVNANRKHNGLGGHISTFASLATLYEVGFNHFFRGPADGRPADMIYFQGHAAPGNYARAYLEGRLTDQHLQNFRQELAKGGGLSSYPHPYLMPEFWQFPTVSMGLERRTASVVLRGRRGIGRTGEPWAACAGGPRATGQSGMGGELQLAAPGWAGAG
jgi:pyruvate dehydrogenase E1 component